MLQHAPTHDAHLRRPAATQPRLTAVTTSPTASTSCSQDAIAPADRDLLLSALRAVSGDLAAVRALLHEVKAMLVQLAEADDGTDSSESESEWESGDEEGEAEGDAEWEVCSDDVEGAGDGDGHCLREGGCR